MKFGRRDSLFASPPPDGGGFELEDDVRQLPPPKAPVVPARKAATELNSFLGRGCTYEGKLTFEGRVRIDGRFTGEIFSNDTLEIGPDAELEAEVEVATVIIAGRVEGNIHASVRCDLRAPGVVIGNITSPIITMDEGVCFDGEMRMSGMADDAVHAPTRRAPMASALIDNPNEIDTAEPPSSGKSGERRSAMAARDPSELLKPVP
jgi:cytoskeletal protein CcmA (bactofilin family)